MGVVLNGGDVPFDLRWSCADSGPMPRIKTAESRHQADITRVGGPRATFPIGGTLVPCGGTFGLSLSVVTDLRERAAASRAECARRGHRPA